MNNSESIFGNTLYSYSRAQAIADGMLVDVSGTPEAIEAGFKFPVAMTRTVWDRCVEVPAGVIGQDVQGRLWDLLYMLRIAIQHGANRTDTVYLELHIRNDNRQGEPPLVSLKAVCGPGDHAEPVIIVMLPEQD
jgi:hypothetical protein